MSDDDAIDQLIAELDRVLPPVFTRAKIEQSLGGLLKSSYLATLDSEGLGPEGSIRCGRHRGYTKRPFLEWLRRRLTAPREQRGIKIPPSRKAANANLLLESLHEYSAM